MLQCTGNQREGRLMIILRSTDPAGDHTYRWYGMALCLGIARIWRIQKRLRLPCLQIRHGGYERVMWCLRDVEDAFGYNRESFTLGSGVCAWATTKPCSPQSNLFTLAMLTTKLCYMISVGLTLAANQNFTVTKKLRLPVSLIPTANPTLRLARVSSPTSEPRVFTASRSGESTRR